MRAARNAASPLCENFYARLPNKLLLFLPFLRRTIFVRLYLLRRSSVAAARRDATLSFDSV